MTKYRDDELRFHHTRCHRNRETIQSSQQAGCFCCLEIFPASEVTAYIDAPPSGDAHCPRCGIDSVIADDGLNEFSPELLRALREVYFMSEEERLEAGIVRPPFKSLFDLLLEGGVPPDAPSTGKSTD